MSSTDSQKSVHYYNSLASPEMLELGSAAAAGKSRLSVGRKENQLWFFNTVLEAGGGGGSRGPPSTALRNRGSRPHWSCSCVLKWPWANQQGSSWPPMMRTVVLSMSRTRLREPET